MLANRTSRWSIGAALICIALLAATWFLLISPRRAEASDVRGQVVQSDVQAATLRSKIAALKIQFADLPKQRAELKAIRLQLPPGAQMPDFVRTLQDLAADSGVSLDSITPAAPVVVSAAGAVTPPTGSNPPIGTLVGIPTSLVVSGDYFEAALFVKKLQTTIRRSYLITGFSAVPGPDAITTATPTATPTAVSTVTPTVVATPTTVVPNLDRVTLSLTGSVFVLLDGTSTFDDVVRDAKAAGTDQGIATPVPTPTTTAAAK
jgi:hypothetical protein